MTFMLAPYALPADYAEGILPLADIKRHVSVDADDDYFDDLLSVFRDAAVDMVERYCSLRLAPCAGLVWRADGLPQRLVLGTGPVVGITAVKWLDSAGTTVTGDPATLRIAGGGLVKAMPGAVWGGAGLGAVAAGLEITFDAGFAEGECPPALVQAARMFAAHLFANRESVSMGTIGGEIPLGFRALCNAYRMPVM